MPLYIEFNHKEKQELISPTLVDEEICKLFQEEPHPKKYYLMWFDTIGLPIALGRTKEEIAKSIEEDWVPSEKYRQDPEAIAYFKMAQENSQVILNYLFDTYDFNSYRRVS